MRLERRNEEPRWKTGPYLDDLSVGRDGEARVAESRHQSHLGWVACTSGLGLEVNTAWVAMLFSAFASCMGFHTLQSRHVCYTM